MITQCRKDTTSTVLGSLLTRSEEGSFTFTCVKVSTLKRIKIRSLSYCGTLNRGTSASCVRSRPGDDNRNDNDNILPGINQHISQCSCCREPCGDALADVCWNTTVSAAWKPALIKSSLGTRRSASLFCFFFSWRSHWNTFALLRAVSWDIGCEFRWGPKCHLLLPFAPRSSSPPPSLLLVSLLPHLIPPPCVFTA